MSLRNQSLGNSLEALNSSLLHQKGIPVLVSPRFLRSYGCGQVDLCIYSKGICTVFEVKSSPGLISAEQRARLIRSVDFITQIMSCQGDLMVIKKLPKDISFLNLNT